VDVFKVCLSDYFEFRRRHYNENNSPVEIVILRAIHQAFLTPFGDLSSLLPYEAYFLPFRRHCGQEAPMFGRR
jgi:hypothetical protein